MYFISTPDAAEQESSFGVHFLQKHVHFKKLFTGAPPFSDFSLGIFDFNSLNPFFSFWMCTQPCSLMPFSGSGRVLPVLIKIIWHALSAFEDNRIHLYKNTVANYPAV